MKRVATCFYPHFFQFQLPCPQKERLTKFLAMTEVLSHTLFYFNKKTNRRVYKKYRKRKEKCKKERKQPLLNAYIPVGHLNMM